jgi:hypothetical protein
MRYKALLRRLRVVEVIVGDSGGPASVGNSRSLEPGFVRKAVPCIHHVFQHAQHDENELANIAKRYYECYRW